DENVGAEAGRLAKELALGADHGPKHERQQQFAQRLKFQHGPASPGKQKRPSRPEGRKRRSPAVPPSFPHPWEVNWSIVNWSTGWMSRGHPSPHQLTN